MNGLATLPGIPESALDGLPPARDLPTIAHRRRYAQALACALTGEKGYELTVWDRDHLPLFMMLRAEQEDWPAVGTAAMVTLIQPAPLPENPGELFARAVAMVPEPMRRMVAEQLACLWAGEIPTVASVEVQEWLARALYRSGRRAREEAVDAAAAADPNLAEEGAC